MGRDGKAETGGPAATRDQVIAAIYETVIRPERFGNFLELWHDHIAGTLAGSGEGGAPAGGGGGMELDPELAGHFARAQEILERLGRSGPAAGLCERIARGGGFVLALRPDGRIVAAGAAARAELGERPQLAGLLDMLDVRSRQILRELMRAPEGEGEAALARVLTTDMKPRHLLVRGEREDGDLLVIEALDFHWSPRADRILAESFALSPAEVRLVRNLMAGLSLREIAERTGRSPHTVRNQTKAVLAKTGAPGQAHLIRLVALLIGADAPEAAEAGPGGGLRSEIMRMSSGLDMQVIHAGAAGGRPVIFLHGMQDGVSPLSVLDDAMIRRGYRVIAPVRPGYGLSAPAPSWDEALPVFVGHVEELIERTMPDQRPLILGNMAGTISGHMLAGRSPARIAGMVGVAGAAPLRARDLAGLAPFQRAMAYAARYAPRLLPFVLRAGIAQVDSRDFDDFLNRLFRPGTHDHEVIRRLGLAGAIQNGYRFAVRQGYSGFAGDVREAIGDWRDRVNAPLVPVILLHGERDPVVAPELMRAFAAGRPRTELRMMADAGQLLIYEWPGRVMDALDELAAAGRG